MESLPLAIKIVHLRKVGNLQVQMSHQKTDKPRSVQKEKAWTNI